MSWRSGPPRSAGAACCAAIGAPLQRPRSAASAAAAPRVRRGEAGEGGMGTSFPAYDSGGGLEVPRRFKWRFRWRWRGSVARVKGRRGARDAEEGARGGEAADAGEEHRGRDEGGDVEERPPRDRARE